MYKVASAHQIEHGQSTLRGLQEVGYISSRPLRLLRCFHFPEDFEITFDLVLYREDCSNVSAAIAVVWRGPNCDQLFAKHVLVPLLHELVRSADELEPIDVIELLGDLRTK